jgi:hypothetical protein
MVRHYIVGAEDFHCLPSQFIALAKAGGLATSLFSSRFHSLSASIPL